MKAIKTSLAALCLFLNFTFFGQCDNNFIINNGESCETAKFICGIDLVNGYLDTLSDVVNQNGPIPLCSNGGGVSNNIQWIKFFVCEDTLEVRITPQNCSIINTNGNDLSGMQAGIYQDCDFTNQLACSNDGNTSAFTLTAYDYVPGSLVYMFLDGMAGSVCEYEITVLRGIDTTLIGFELDSLDIIEDGMVMGQDTVCANGIEDYTFSLPTCLGFGQGAGGCAYYGFAEAGLICYEWIILNDQGTVAHDSTYNFVGDSTLAEVTIEWLVPGNFQVNVTTHTNPNYVKCIASATICGNLEPLDVIVLPSIYNYLPDVFLCEGESYDFCGVTYTESVIAYCEIDTCEFDVQEIIFSEPEFNYLGPQYVCQGSGCFILNGQEYCTPGSYSIPDPNALCEAHNEFDIIALETANLNLNLSNDIDCIQSNAQLTANLNLSNYPNNMTVEWFDQSGISVGSGFSINVQRGGDYTCYVSFPNYQNLCDVQESIFVVEQTDPVEAEVSDAKIDCINSSATLSYTANMNIEYQRWDGPNGYASEEVSPSIVKGGNYLLTLRGENGCEYTDSFEVEEDIQDPVATLDGDEYWYCTTENITLSLSVEDLDNYTVEWQSSDGTIVDQNQEGLTAGSIGNYTAIITDNNNGCVTQLSHELINDPETFQDFIFFAEDVHCFGEHNGAIIIQDFIGGVEPFILTLNGLEVTEEDLFLLSPGMYDLEITDANGCNIQHLTEVREPEMLDFEIADEIEVVFEQTDVLQITYSSNIEVASIIWENMTGNMIGQGASIDASFLNNEVLLVTLTDVNGCQVSKEVEINIKLADQYYVPNIFSPNQDGVNDFFTAYAVHSPGIIKELSVFDRWGELLYQVEGSKLNDESEGWNGMFNGRALPAAVYVYEIKVDRGDGELDVEYGSVTLVR